MRIVLQTMHLSKLLQSLTAPLLTQSQTQLLLKVSVVGRSAMSYSFASNTSSPYIHTIKNHKPYLLSQTGNA